MTVMPYPQEAAHFLKQLLSINSTTSDRAEFAHESTEATHFVADYLQQKTGAEIHYTEPYEFPKGSGKLHKGMVAVWRPQGHSTKNPLAFSAHIDTVPAVGLWDGNDPYVGREEGDKIIGRGALDIKGQVASLAVTMKAKHDRGELKTIDRPIVFMLSSCEEVGLLGAKGVCDLTREKVGIPDEITVMEPTDGYIGIGCKGVRQTDIKLTNKAPVHVGNYTHYMTVEIGSASGHSSLQAASPADPALMVTKVLAKVKELRARGIDAEVCHVDYGTAANVVGGNAKIIVGYDAAQNDPTGEKTYNTMRRHFEVFEQTKSNLTLRFFTVAGNLVNRINNQVHGIDLGSVSINVNRHPRSQHEEAPDYPKTLTLQPDGSMRPHSAIEHGIEVVQQIYEHHAAQRDEGGKPEHYAIPLLGVTKLSVPMIQGDAASANLSSDMRYPVEALRGDAGKNIRSADSITAAIAAAAKQNPSIAANLSNSTDILPYKSSTPQDGRLQPYLEIGKATRFTRFTDAATCVPYASDGNVIAQEFPDALIMTMAHGGYAQMPHGVGEHLTKKQIGDNMTLFGAIIDGRTRGMQASASLSAAR
ncbi:MAG: M20/M25/M40 family metallo-hydrolase [Rickettsiales bacterium]|nr:M20/M25/M40 family metallo-hydrolase [Rickettsiales bacterium]